MNENSKPTTSAKIETASDRVRPPRPEYRPGDPKVSHGYAGGGGGERDREPVATERVDSDRKTYWIDLMQNERGCFVRLSEKCGHHRDTVRIEADKLPEIIAALERLQGEYEARC